MTRLVSEIHDVGVQLAGVAGKHCACMYDRLYKCGGKRLHTRPSYPPVGPPQGFGRGTLTNKLTNKQVLPSGTQATLLPNSG